MKSSNGYQTKQRALILSCLQKNRSQHITVDKILTYLRSEGLSIGQTTIYRNLDKLVKEGIVLKYAPVEGRGACYQYVDQTDNIQPHYHLVCIDCGQMLHLQCHFLDKLSSHMSSHHNFCLDKYKTVLYGLCNDCAAVK
ncbi:MAG: Fur family transcriptional regulator [Bacillota bacterium]